MWVASDGEEPTSTNEYSSIHLRHKSVNQNAELEFRMILNSQNDVNRTWALCLCMVAAPVVPASAADA